MIQQATRNSEDQLVRENMPLVHYAVAEIASRIPSYVSRNDLVSAAMFGLAQAAHTWEPARGVPFDRYASTRVRGALLDELRSHDWASRSVRAKSRQMQAATDKLRIELRRDPTSGELAGEMNVDETQVDKLVDDVHRATVLNYESLVIDGSFEDFLPSGTDSPEQELETRERHGYLTDAISALPERLRQVVVGYFFEDKSMQELAAEMNVSESRISQLRTEALALLKGGINSAMDPEPIRERSAKGRIARRKLEYYETVAAVSDFKTRITQSDTERHARLGVTQTEDVKAVATA